MAGSPVPAESDRGAGGAPDGPSPVEAGILADEPLFEVEELVAKSSGRNSFDERSHADVRKVIASWEHPAITNEWDSLGLER